MDVDAAADEVGDQAVDITCTRVAALYSICTMAVVVVLSGLAVAPRGDAASVVLQYRSPCRAVLARTCDSRFLLFSISVFFRCDPRYCCYWATRCGECSVSNLML